MYIAHLIALHTREVRAIGDLDAYISYQLDSIFAGLLAKPERRIRGNRKTRSAKKTAASRVRCR